MSDKPSIASPLELLEELKEEIGVSSNPTVDDLEEEKPPSPSRQGCGGAC